MFEFLKKKISSWLGKDKEKEEKQKKEKKKAVKLRKKAEKPAKQEKKTGEKKRIEEPVSFLTKEEKETKQEVEQIIEETEVPIERQIEETKKEKVTEKSQEGNFFTRLIKKITASKLTKEDFETAFQDLEITLLENNVALEAVDAIKDSLSFDLVGQQMKKTEAEARILQSLKDSILKVLIEPPDLIKQIQNHPGVFIILFFGINGTGKTTTIAKIANLLKKKKISCVMAAADTFRAASIEQLKIHGEKIEIPVIANQYGADPASVAFDAIAHAKKNDIKVVLIDTAGRMYTKENLLKEMEKIVRVSQPDLKIFVGESITGNDAIEQARIFKETIGIDGIILSKADVDEKAGTILSVSQVTKKPIYFLGIGQGYDDLEVFSKKNVLKHLGL
jgi:fused signal recognition particle receptor